MAIERPQVTPEMVQNQFAETQVTRRRALLPKVNGFIHRMEEVSGTEKNYLDTKRFAAFLAIMIGTPLVAGELPNHDLGMHLSNAIAGFGGVFIGATIRPTRITEFNTREFRNKVQDLSVELPHAQLVSFFSTYTSDILTENEIKSRLLNRLPGPDQKPSTDLRYKVVDRLAQEHAANYTGLRSGKNAKVYAKDKRDYVTEQIMVAQLSALEKLSDRSVIRHESARKIVDMLSGLVVVGGASALINLALNGTAGGLVGSADEIVFAAALVGSVALRKIRESNELAMSDNVSTARASYRRRAGKKFIPRIQDQHEQDQRGRIAEKVREPRK